MQAKVPDKALLAKVNQRLGRTGTGSNTRVVATVRSGDVTLTGTLNNEMQRSQLMRAASGVAGVRRVVDQMKVVVVKKTWS